MSYAEERQRNIERNRELLASLDIGPLRPKYEPKESSKKKATKKRRPSTPGSDGCEEPPKKISRLPDDGAVSGGTRRSSRLAGRTVDYKQEQDRGVPEPITFQNKSQKLKVGKVQSQRTYDPSVFPFVEASRLIFFFFSRMYGDIPDVEVGTWWATR